MRSSLSRPQPACEATKLVPWPDRLDRKEAAIVELITFIRVSDTSKTKLTILEGSALKLNINLCQQLLASATKKNFTARPSRKCVVFAMELVSSSFSMALIAISGTKTLWRNPSSVKSWNTVGNQFLVLQFSIWFAYYPSAGWICPGLLMTCQTPCSDASMRRLVPGLAWNLLALLRPRLPWSHPEGSLSISLFGDVKDK